LLEKLPINAFRIPFLAAAIPDARFLVILRDGTVVANSIRRFAARHPWYGADGYKWRQLVAIAESQPATRGLAGRCRDDFDRGLLEWRLSVETASRTLPWTSLTHVVRYEDLVGNAVAVMRGILHFLELSPAPEVLAFARDRIAVQDTSSGPQPLDDTGFAIAGALLSHLGYRPPRVDPARTTP
jgi:hypothetical protein